MRPSLPALLLVFATAGCSVPVAAGLEEGDANRVALALDRAHVDAVKDVDPGAEGHYRVMVGRDDAARALAVLRNEELPRRRPAGVLEAVGKGALVPSRAAEHAQYVAGLGGELERTMSDVDGVLAARVHLNVPEHDPLREGAPAKATASVLVEHRGPTPPLAVEAVQHLVAGGVGGLAPADVSVVMVPRPVPPSADSSLGHVGPIAVARGSVRVLLAILGGGLALVAALAAATLVLYLRLLRLRDEKA